MSFLTAIKSRVERGNQAFRFGQLGGSYGANDPWGGLWRMLSGSTFDYRREAGITWENSIVVLGISWVWRNFPAARLYVERPTGKILDNGEPEYQEIWDHPLTLLFSKPNPYYSRRVLWKGLLLSRMVDGNSFIFINRNKLGMPVELYYVPHFTISPRWLGKDDQDQDFEYPGQSSNYLNYWEHRIDGKVDKWKPYDVFHWRDGIDPQNARRGLSPLTSVLREIAADNCASTMSASLLRNNNVPGLIVSARMGADGKSSFSALTNVQEDKIREMGKQKWTGDRAGELAIIPAPVDFNRMSFSPKEMDLAPLRSINQELILAQWGLSKALLNLGKEQSAGTKAGSTLKGQIAMAYDMCLIPMQDDLAEELTFWGQREFSWIWQDGDRVAFDRSKIAALQDDVNELHERVRADWMADLIQRGEGRKIFGMGATEEDNVYYSQVAGMSASGETIESGAEEDSEEEPDDEISDDDAAKSLPVKKKSTKSEDDDDDDDEEKKKRNKALAALLLGLIGDAEAAVSQHVSIASADPDKFARLATESLRKIHSRAATLGRLRAKNSVSSGEASEAPENVGAIEPNEADELAGSVNAESQLEFLEKLANQIESGQLSDKQIAQRIRGFAQRIVGTANESWKNNLPSDTQLTWNDTGDKSECEDCYELGDGSPWTPETIPTMPGMRATQCNSECRCYVTTDTGASSFYHPEDEMP